MKNKIFVTIFGMILLIGIVSALDISLDAGENYVINFGNDNPVNWTISGIDEGYLNISQVNSYVTISLDKYAPSSNFSIDFYTMKEQTESSTSGSSGGGGYDPNWKNPATIVNPVNTTSTNQNITEEKEPSNETSTTNNVTDSKFPVWIIITILLIVIGLFLLVRKIISNKEREGDEEEYGEE